MTSVCVTEPATGSSAAPTHAQDLALQTHLADSYKDVTCLSHSASCSVWLVTLAGAQEKQILKIFPVSQQAAFRREAAISFGMSHANVVKCLDTFLMPGGMSCLSYEYATGGNLATFFDGRQADAQTVRVIVEDILGGMQHLHSQRYVHCDIKPANILVSRQAFEKRWWFKLGDLGSAATLKEAQSGRYGVGSPAYCAPERLYNQFGFASDIYSLGILTFELLAGHLPFTGEVDAVHRAHLNQALPVGDIQDLHWREWLERATHKSPRDRFETAADALAALKNRSDQSPAQTAPVAAPATGHLSFDALANTKTVAAPNAANPVALAVASRTPINVEIGTADPAVMWSEIGSYSPAPQHHEIIADTDRDSLFLVSDVGISMLQLPGGALSAVTSTKPPYAVHAGRIVYSTGGRITEVAPKSQQRVTLCEQADTPVALAVNDQFIGFVDHQRVVLQRKKDASVCVALKHRHYAMDPLMALGHSSFVVTGGLANNEVWHRRVNGDVIARLSIDGPCIAMRAIDSPDSDTNVDGFLIICTSLRKPDMLNLYVLRSTGDNQVCRLPCSSLAVATCSTGMAFIASNGCVTWVSTALKSSVISQPMSNLYSLALTQSGDCCFLSSREQGKTRIKRISRQ